MADADRDDVGAEDELVDVGPAGDDDAEVLEEADQALAEGEAELAAEAAGVDPSLEVLIAERDEYLEALRRVKAEFENSRKRWTRERDELVGRAASNLAGQLLPVLDACEAAIDQGAADVEPVRRALLDVLEKEGLEEIPTEGAPFDPNLHEAVMFEAGDGGEQVVAERLRTGYQWKGQVLRAAMVKVRG